MVFDNNHPSPTKSLKCRQFQEGSCHSNGKAKSGVTIDGFAYVPKRNNTALKIALAKYGAAAVSVNANPMTFKFYGWGIYDDPQCGRFSYKLFRVC